MQSKGLGSITKLDLVLISKSPQATEEIRKLPLHIRHLCA